MDFAYARHLAESVVFQLAPMCDKIQICGGVRRHKPEPHDIDIVLIPRRDSEKDMFGTITGYHVTPEFIQCVNQWTKIKGEPYGKYTQRLLKGGIHLELSIATADNYGCLQLIRTGDSDFSHLIMKRVLKCGFEQRDGYLWDGDKKIPIPDEKDYFNILNLPYIEPKDRDANAFRTHASQR